MTEKSTLLHITNGDAAIKVMRMAGFTNPILSWLDILHDGPVPEGLDLAELSRRRATFVHECGFTDLATAQKSFRARDDILENCHSFQTIFLWFEPDLFDQLQLLQILSELGRLGHDGVWLIQSNHYLGRLRPEELPAIRQTRHPVTKELYDLASRAWAAFRASKPDQWANLLTQETALMPFLQSAIVRHLEHYPDPRHGLNRTQRQILESIKEGASQRWSLFQACQDKEEYPFMGDASFWLYLDELTHGQAVARDSQEGFLLTSLGHALLDQQTNWIHHQGLNRWLGGVHLTLEHVWYWDTDKQELFGKDAVRGEANVYFPAVRPQGEHFS
ncbi:MAG: DUF1835 domain-containing protein [Magnetococcus sp. YQC-5]